MNKFIAAAALALIATTASAADSNFYVGGDIGSSKFKADGDSRSKTGFGATLGYTLNPNVAFELTARRLGSFKEDGSKLSVNALQASVLGIAPITNEFSIYGRLGMGRNSLDLSEGAVSASVHKNKALVGIGASYQVAKNVALRGEYTNLGNNKVGDTSVKMHQFNVGMTYAF
ncbi:outer membrane beta-barrel protein [Paucibacter sp. DJ2R-2]|uniref:outer membrane beta-barrel protein n=1 Tax=Paucibacter sp. DJ2R-2 TaxID=2893558 RepID=UPI0021E38F43|nr:outer membrane beta-barrel protein [Paucibacter sp. DJ2R-2]MCV2422498.1 outer membrane beta-barrel protein [Paucibacter sp. DJ4R-1]MCV2440350.1 outer membrane beta-barrel protein [Paucibacter sp. DJ2R-2]